MRLAALRDWIVLSSPGLHRRPVSRTNGVSAAGNQWFSSGGPLRHRPATPCPIFPGVRRSAFTAGRLRRTAADRALGRRVETWRVMRHFARGRRDLAEGQGIPRRDVEWAFRNELSGRGIANRSCRGVPPGATATPRGSMIGDWRRARQSQQRAMAPPHSTRPPSGPRQLLTVSHMCNPAAADSSARPHRTVRYRHRRPRIGPRPDRSSVSSAYSGTPRTGRSGS